MMSVRPTCLSPLAAIVLPLFVAPGGWGADVRESETIRRTLDFGAAAGERRLEVDNVHGPIAVVGVPGQTTVDLVAVRSVRADTKEDLEAAKRDVRLDITEGATITLYVDGPFRDRRRGRDRDRDRTSGRRRGGRDDLGYTVEYDFQLRVPVGIAVRLRTVNGGAITAERIDGRFDVRNVNGEVRLSEMGGVGEASTVNGEVAVAFTRVPTAACAFKTVNGDVTVRVPDGFQSDIEVQTLNGEVFTDFEVVTRPSAVSAETRRDGKRVFRAGRGMALRVGAGGPAMHIETLNGDIQFRKAS